MQMTSIVFFAMTAAVFAVLYIVNRAVKNEQKCITASNIILIVFSYIFVAFADWRFAAVLAVLTLSTWLCAKKRKTTVVGIIIALAALAFFKYTDFFAESFAKIVGSDYTALNIILPLGVSFYTFSAIGYLIDVKRGKEQPASLVEVGLYLSFFPKITSGPIHGSSDFFRQMNTKREIGLNTFSAGIQIFVFGLLKKMVIADRLSVFADQVFGTPNAFGSLTVLMGVFAYSLQIYFDFSGYSDMAIGVAKIIGFDLQRNFNLPYLSRNVTEFWKRWHITLSEWLMKYLYISMGGNRKGKARTYFNLVMTMVLGGLWHGANWTYIVWGLLHGLALIVHKLWMNITKSPEKEHGAAANCISVFFTFLYVSFCWIFFRAETVGQAFDVIKRIFSFSAGVEQPYIWFFIALAVIVAGSAAAIRKSLPLKNTVKKKNFSYVNGFYPVLDLNKFGNLVIFFIVCGLVLCLAYTGGSPFIYGKY